MSLRRLLRHVDWLAAGACLALICAGLMFIMSATHAQPVGGDSLYYAKRQALWAVVGIATLIATASVDYSLILRLGPWVYWANVAVLVLVLVAGESAYGAQRWLQVGPVRIQPSEFAKIALIVSFASFLQARSEDGPSLRRVRDLFPGFIFVGIPMVLVFQQPDLGTSLVFVGILIGMFFAAGADPRPLFGAIGGVIAAAGLALFAHYRYGLPIPLRDYQVRRIMAFIQPGNDLRYAGYHTHQSQIAIGSGRLLGKGFMAGSQNQLNFLPQRHTDFIFSVIGEEVGFLGAVVILGLFLLLMWRGVIIAANAKDIGGTLIAAGVVSMLAFHVLVNVGMACGIMPVTGLPLPFISSGGSSLMANCAAVGLLINVGVRRFKIYF